MNILNLIKTTPLSVLIATSLISSPVLATNKNLQTITLQPHSSLEHKEMSETNTVELTALFKASNIQNSKAIKLAASSCEQSRNENRRCETLEKF